MQTSAYVKFKDCTPEELEKYALEWEKQANYNEHRIEMCNRHNYGELKLNRVWEEANKYWKMVYALERFKNRKEKGK